MTEPDEPLMIYSIEHYDDTPYHENLTYYHTDNNCDTEEDTDIIDYVENWMLEKGIFGIYVRPFYLDIEYYDKCNKFNNFPSSLVRSKLTKDIIDDDNFFEVEGHTHLGEANDETFYLVNDELKEFEDRIVYLKSLNVYYSESDRKIEYDSSKVNFCKICRSYYYDFSCPKHT